jgi:immune inhibitor A
MVLGLLAAASAVAAVPVPPVWSHPADALPHLAPPNPAVGSWPEYLRNGAPIPPPEPLQTTGTAKVLVLLVEFTDVSHDAAHDAAYLDGVYNASSPARSMRAYYEEVSRGALTVQATIVPTWWPSLRTMAHYGADAGTGVDNANGPIYRLVTETVRAADPSVDFRPFDANSDGVLDHLVVVHAGDGQEESPAMTDRIWSHRWAVLDADPALPGSQTLSADGVQVYGYIMTSESSPVGVAAHEFGHDLGLPDLYDTDDSSEGAGLWDIMAGGSWNGFPAGSSPAHPSAWSKLKLGWMSPVDVGAARVGETVPAIETSGRAYRLGVSGTLGREYFLVENRQSIGFDAGLPGSGLLIWHVDDSRVTNDDDARRLVDLEEADEGTTGDRPTDPQDAWQSTAVGWGPETTPSSRAYSGVATGWRVREVSASGDPMTATIARDVQRDVSITEIRAPFAVPMGTQVNATVVARNDGTRTESVGVVARAYRDRLEPTSLVQEASATASVAAQSSLAFNLTFTAGTVARYLVYASAASEGDEIPTNNERVVHVNADRFSFRDDVEGGSPGWTLDGDPDDLHRWRIVADADEDGSSHSPDHAWRFGFASVLLPTLLPPEWHALTSPSISVPGAPVSLVFYHRYDLWGRTVDTLPINLSESDRARVELRVGGGPWILLSEYTGRDLAWRGVSLNLSSVVGAAPATIQVRFNASSGSMPESGGWWVDDVMVVERGLGRAVVLLPAQGPYPAPPGGTARFDLKIANVGDYEEPFEFLATAPGPGFRVRVESNASLADLDGFAVRLAPDADAVLRIVVEVPGSATPGPWTGTITARSRADLAVSTSVAFEIAVGEVPFYLTPTFLIGMGLAGVALVAAIALARSRRRRRPGT